MGDLDNLGNMVAIVGLGMMAMYFCDECGKSHRKDSNIGHKHRDYDAKYKNKTVRKKKKKGGK